MKKRRSVSDFLVRKEEDDNYWKKEIIRLAAFLREKYPQEVEENTREPFNRSSAVDLTISLLIAKKEGNEVTTNAEK